MAIKAKVDTIDGMQPIDPKTAFKKDADGRWILDVDSVDGLVLENVDGLRTSVSQARAERDRFKATVDAFGDIKPDAAKAAIAKLAELGDLSKLTNEQKTQEAIASLRSQMEGKSASERAAFEAQVKELESDLHNEMVVGRAARAMVGKVKAPKVMLPHILARLKIEKAGGKRVLRVVNEDGTVAITKKSGSTEPMEVDELVDLLGKDPEFAPNYAGTGATGGGTGSPGTTKGSQGAGGPIQVPRSQQTRAGVLEGVAMGTHVLVDG